MCVASVRSITHAIKAKKALEGLDIKCDIIKLEPYMTKKGCAYGVQFQCVNLYSAKDALDKKSVKYSEIISL
ncbi:MAG: DUF3343 domain-containing protein [Clostridia bacterium]|nr:DUF3343 domain-containing protein [Clostridia bacterium]